MLSRSLLALFALSIGFSCSKPEGSASFRDVVSQTTPAPKRLASGLFHADSLLTFTMKQLGETFGKQNIAAKQAGSAMESSSYHVAVLFPNSKKQIEIVLEDSTQQAHVKAVVIGKNSIWTTRAGVIPGMTLRELEALNGRPFLFYGGGWDQGGYVTNWKDGQLRGKINSCRLDRHHIMPYDMSKGDYDVHEFSSDSRDAQNGNPVVEEVTLSHFQN